ncbi:4Fe-4S dicluster domain-containing protein [Thermanaerosceptrum fracticalcis]|uniref:4Fe-4S dicluster domain-containing protein n=1 Tax=Thermanaerosceptrum fracticalcis TaxID=1712410 RepID=A0A7G6E3N4_THEFR|nr:NIL domain-containing protein [Thermanaerosceptrum fracticalcis]QNB46688.1 4Fe-4S dicluster domain-containing protein [Thermanaerosceptrum fracticalcis]
MAPEKIVLRFSAETADKPIIYHLVKDYDLIINIVKASINPHKEGTMVLELSGEKYKEGISFLRKQGITVQPLTQEVVRNEERCTSCGACTVHCPTQALYMERPSMEVKFDGDNCIVCLMCLKVCPVQAMEVRI